MSKANISLYRLYLLLTWIAIGTMASPASGAIEGKANPNGSPDTSLVLAVQKEVEKSSAGASAAGIFISNITILDSWAIGTIGLMAPAQANAGPEGRLFVAQQTVHGWQVALQYTAQFRVWLESAPLQLVDPATRSILLDEGIAGDGSAFLSLPWATGETWTLTGGPHSNDGSGNHPWSALDFTGSSGQVRAARDGVAYLDCPNFVRIVHADGWETGYYHLTNIAVSNGQAISRAQLLGNISTQIGCGGSAMGPHQHFSLRKNGISQAVNGHDIGGWTVQEGVAEYQGCLIKNGNTQCAPSGQIYNDGTIGSGGCCGCALINRETSKTLPRPNLGAFAGEVGMSRLSSMPAASVMASPLTESQDERDMAARETDLSFVLANVLTLPAPTDLRSRTHQIGVPATARRIQISWAPPLQPETTGVAGYAYRWDNEPATMITPRLELPPNASGVTHPPLTDGVWFFHLRAVDGLGNGSDMAHLGPFVIDTAPPVSGSDVTGTLPWTNDATMPAFTWSAAADINGVKGYLVYWGEQAQGEGQTLVMQPAFQPTETLPPDVKTAVRYLRVAAMDSASNIGPWQTKAVWRYDVALPEGEVMVGQGTATSYVLPVTLHLAAQDQESGVTAMRFSANGQDWTDWQTYAPIFPWVLADQPGIQTVHAQVRDYAGNLSPILSATVTVQLELPLSVSLNYTLGRSLFSMGGGEKTSPGFTIRGSSGQTFQAGLMQGPTYQIVSGFWAGVNPLTPTPTPTPIPTDTPTPTPTHTPTPPPVDVVDDRDYSIQYDGWYGGLDATALGGGYRAAVQTSQYLAYRTTQPATSVILRVCKGPNLGIANVLIDGAPQPTLDLYAPAPACNVPVQYAGLANSLHLILFLPSGQKNAASSGTEVRLDAFQVNLNIVDDSHPSVIYTRWSGLALAPARQGSLRLSQTASAFITFTFSGTAFSWTTAKCPMCGQALVIVDGSVDLVDTYSPSWQFQVPESIAGLSNGTHTVTIRVLGTHNPNSSGNIIFFDGFTIP